MAAPRSTPRAFPVLASWLLLSLISLALLPGRSLVAEDDDTALAGAARDATAVASGATRAPAVTERDLAHLKRPAASEAKPRAFREVFPLTLLSSEEEVRRRVLAGGLSRSSTVSVSRREPPLSEFDPSFDEPGREDSAPIPAPGPRSLLDGVDPWDVGLSKIFPQLRELPPNSRLQRVFHLARRICFRELRRYFRSQLKHQFLDDPSGRYFTYVDEKKRISGLGRSARTDRMRMEEEILRVRHGSLSGDPEDQEPSITLIDWGPFHLDDNGRLGVDLGRFKDPNVLSDEIEIGPEEDPDASLGQSLLKGQRYRFNTDLKFRPHLRSLAGSDQFPDALGEVSASVRVDLLSPILKKRLVGAELETSLESDGEAAVFLSIRLYCN